MRGLFPGENDDDEDHNRIDELRIDYNLLSETEFQLPFVDNPYCIKHCDSYDAFKNAKMIKDSASQWK